jgi:hypothetical protein
MKWQVLFYENASFVDAADRATAANLNVSSRLVVIQGV